MGTLVTIEGGEFMGKTSMALPGLVSVAKKAGYAVASSREPGGTPEAEAIRAEIFQKVEQKAPIEEIAVLFNKARKNHLEQVIHPFIGAQKEKEGIMVLDRYLDSTRVYQGLEGGLDLEYIHQLETEYVKGYLPDITFILTIPADKFARIILARQKIAAMESGRDHTVWDEASIEQQLLRQKRYLELPALASRWQEQREFHVIDASRHPFDVIGDIVRHLGSYLEKKGQGGAKGKLEQSYKELKKSPGWILLEKAWKKQEHQLKSV